ncbi:hypothetical protein RhiXN_01715 [Rhizoctonia solani]|uniref:Uncharacterized protein n=1 Tax=Rhizoctonia solani TaxID=456999 RepID=A0A8H8P9K1_9AGAM|nr:uncharacterized protein RhiXN_01715 [Rhizoctonia solani]QRW27120.1 hypothetical protein RhiXN_01715 [Rhizoctonia solani]
MAPRGILKPPSVFPLEHELRGHEGERTPHIFICSMAVTWPTHTRAEPRKTRSRSRSRDRRHADEMAVVSNGYQRERLPSAHSSRLRARSRHRSKSRSRRHVRWSEPVAFVVSDGTDMLVQQLRHRRSSLPAILEDTRAIFRESVREKDKKESRSSDKDSSSSRHAPDTFHPSHSSSPPRRPPLKSTLSTPDVGKASQLVPSPKHRRRRTSLPNGLEAALKASSHALWLPHHTEGHSHEHSSSHGKDHHDKDHSVKQVDGRSVSHSKNSSSGSHSRPSTNSHSRSRTSTSHSHASQTPRHYDTVQLPPHVHEQPHLRGGASYFSNHNFVAHYRRLPQIIYSKSSRSSSSKSSPPEKITPPLPSPVPSTKPSIEPQTPKSIRSNLFSFPTIDDIFSKDETSHSMKSVRRLFGLSTPKHEPRKLSGDEISVKKSKHSRGPSKDLKEDNPTLRCQPARSGDSSPARHSFDLGTFSLLDDMHMRWTTATARHFLPVLTPAEIQTSHLTLTLNPAFTTIHWDIRHPPNAVWSVIPGRRSVLWTGHNEPATVPLVPSLRIISPYFPWLVWRGEFDKLRPEDKTRLAAGYHANRPANGAPKTADSPFDAGSWLVRADWLGRYTVLRGMTVSEGKDKNGSPLPDVLLNMYLTENRREADRQAVVLVRH